MLINIAAANSGSASMQALAEAVGLVERAIEGLRAAGDVEWQSRAADLYRADAMAALHDLARDREVLDGAVWQAGGGWMR